jgi:hypothetical protein
MSSFSVNRSRDNGCSYVFMTYQQANKTVNQVNDIAYKTQVDAEQKPAEVIRSLEVQLKLLKSEVEKTQFYFYVDIFAQLIFRGFQIFYYVIEIILLLYVVKLTFQVPSTMIRILNVLGESKKKRKQESILNK